LILLPARGELQKILIAASSSAWLDCFELDDLLRLAASSPSWLVLVYGTASLWTKITVPARCAARVTEPSLKALFERVGAYQRATRLVLVGCTSPAASLWECMLSLGPVSSVVVPSDVRTSKSLNN